MRRGFVWSLLLTIAVGSFFACNDAPKFHRPKTWVVRAGPYVVEARELDAYVSRLALENGIPRERLMTREFLLKTAKRLLEQKVLESLAKQAHIVVPDSKVELKLDELKKGVGEKRFEERLKSSGLSIDTLRKLIERDLLVQEYLTERVISRIVVDDDELEEEYEKSADELVLPERVRARHIVVDSEEEARQIKRDIYKKRITFKEAAKRYSIAPEAARGGDLGWFAKDEMPPFFTEHCFKLPKGVIGGPFESPYGYHLFLVEDRQPERKLTFEEAKPILWKKVFERKKKEAEKKVVQKVLSSYIFEERLDEVYPQLRTTEPKEPK